MPLRRRVRVLVIDDEPAICKALTLALTRAGLDAVSAQSGEAALSILRTERVDILLVDLRIPDMRGDSIFEYAAAEQPHLRHQTLFMTGDISDRGYELIAACKCPFLRKPFDLKDMIDTILHLTPDERGGMAG